MGKSLRFSRFPLPRVSPPRLSIFSTSPRCIYPPRVPSLLPSFEQACRGRSKDHSMAPVMISFTREPYRLLTLIATDTIHLTKLTMLVTKHNPETEPCSTEISNSLHPQLTERSAPSVGFLGGNPTLRLEYLGVECKDTPWRAYGALVAKCFPAHSNGKAQGEVLVQALSPLSPTGYSNVCFPFSSSSLFQTAIQLFRQEAKVIRHEQRHHPI